MIRKFEEKEKVGQSQRKATAELLVEGMMEKNKVRAVTPGLGELGFLKWC